MRSSVILGLTGFSLIAITYGMARFAWGLMLPTVMHDIPFTPRLAGVLSAGSFAAYCIAVMVAPRLTARAGPRLPAAFAALSAASGLFLLSVAGSPLMLGVGLLIAGLGAGFASPALAAAVSQQITVARQPQMNTVINAGTSAGIMVSVAVLYWLPGGWRGACVLFGLLALICLVPLWRRLPGDVQHLRTAPWQRAFRQRSLLRLILIAFISGLASAAWWSFGPALLQRIDVKESTVSLLWLIGGAAGIFGALTGPLAERIGMVQVYRLSQLCLAAPILLLALSHHFIGWFYPAVALGGAGYVTLSGVLLVWGAAATEKTPATGVSVLFFMLAAGQIAGSVLFGQLYVGIGTDNALLLFTALPLLMLFAVRRNR